MPRNSSGTYSLPVAAYVAGTTIRSADMNSNLSDIATALTQSVATTGVSPMTGPLYLAAGSLAAPSLSLASDHATGWYNNAAGAMTYVSVGVAILGLSGSGASLIGSLTVSTSLQVGTTLIVASTTTMQGILTIAVASNTAVFRNTTNDTNVNFIVTFQQGSGAGQAASIRAAGTAANDITAIAYYMGATLAYGYTATSINAFIPFRLSEIAVPAAPAANTGLIYAYLDTTTKLAYKNSAGNIHYIAPVGGIITEAFGSYALNTNLSATIPIDDTIPQTGEGDLIISQAITIKNANSRIRVRAQGQWGATSINSTLIMAIFDSATGANAIAAVAQNNDGSNSGSIQQAFLEWEYAAPAAGAVTYTLRAGCNSAYRFNGIVSARLLGGSSHVTLLIEEIQQA